VTDIRDARPIGDPRDDSGGYCCVAAGMHMGHDEDCVNWACPTCNNTGGVPLGEHFVTHEIALDCGSPELEGQSMGIEWGPCPDCDGARRLRERRAVAPTLRNTNGGVEVTEEDERLAASEPPGEEQG